MTIPAPNTTGDYNGPWTAWNQPQPKPATGKTRATFVTESDASIFDQAQRVAGLIEAGAEPQEIDAAIGQLEDLRASRLVSGRS